jgi:hypothetical protein
MVRAAAYTQNCCIPTTMNVRLLALPFCLLATCSSLLAQGSLTPPGAPTPTMKSLDQIEARTPISSAPFTISVSGSYYLTGNLAVTSGAGVIIAADFVTLDLNGYTISSTAGSAANAGVGLSGSSHHDITIRNGHISGTTTVSGSTFTPGGFVNGIGLGSSGGENVRIPDVTVLGVAQNGIKIPQVASNAVDRCSVSICGVEGIIAGQIRDCVAENTGSIAIDATQIASHCYGACVGGGAGISASVVDNCIGSSNTGDGILSGGTVKNSTGTSASGNGISASAVDTCAGSSNTGSGIRAGASANNCIGTSSTGNGLIATSATNCQGTSVSGGSACAESALLKMPRIALVPLVLAGLVSEFTLRTP